LPMNYSIVQAIMQMLEGCVWLFDVFTLPR